MRWWFPLSSSLIKEVILTAKGMIEMCKEDPPVMVYLTWVLIIIGGFLSLLIFFGALLLDLPWFLFKLLVLCPFKAFKACRYFFHPQRAQVKELRRMLGKLKQLDRTLGGADPELQEMIGKTRAQIKELCSSPALPAELRQQTKELLAETRKKALEPYKQEILDRARTTLEKIEEVLAVEKQVLADQKKDQEDELTAQQRAIDEIQQDSQSPPQDCLTTS